MFVAGISVEMFTAASTLFFYNPICEKTRNNTPNFFICSSKPLDLSLITFKKKSKYKLRTKFKVKGQPYKYCSNLKFDDKFGILVQVLLAQWITWLTRDRCNPKMPSSIPAGGKDFP